MDTLLEVLAESDRQGLRDEIRVIETGCNGFCAPDPIILVQKEIAYINREKCIKGISCITNCPVEAID